MGPAMALLAKFLLPGNVGMGNHLPGVCALWCGHGRDTPGTLTVLVGRAQPMDLLVCHLPGWFGARFGPQSLLSSWGLPGWGKSLRGAPEKAHLDWHGPLGQPSVPSLGTHGWGQRWRWGDPAVPGLLGDGAVIPPQNGVCGHLHGAHQCHTDRDGVCVWCCHCNCGGSRVFLDYGGFGLYWERRGPRVWLHLAAAGGTGAAMRISAAQPT